MTLGDLIEKLSDLAAAHGDDLRVGYGEGYDYVDEFIDLDHDGIRIGSENDRAGKRSVSEQGSGGPVVWLH